MRGCLRGRLSRSCSAGASSRSSTDARDAPPTRACALTSRSSADRTPACGFPTARPSRLTSWANPRISYREENVSAQQSETAAPSWFPCSHGHTWWSTGAEEASREGSQAPHGHDAPETRAPVARTFGSHGRAASESAGISFESSADDVARRAGISWCSRAPARPARHASESRRVERSGAPSSGIGQRGSCENFFDCIVQSCSQAPTSS
jgi:hypothetical protein